MVSLASKTEIICDQKIKNKTQEMVVLSHEKPNHELKSQFQIKCRLIHSVPGRIRFRVPKVKKDGSYAQALSILAGFEEHITDIKIKPAASSVVFYYAKGFCNLETMTDRCWQLIQQASSHPELALTNSCEDDQKKPVSWAALRMPFLATLLSVIAGPLGISLPPLLVGGVIAIASIPIAKRAFESVWAEKRLNVDFLDFSAIVIVTCQSHFLTSCSMVALIQLGETIREHTARSSKNQTLDLLNSLAKFAWVERNGEKVQIPLDQIQLEDTVIVYPGEQIPVDGRILTGKALIDEQKLTGESMPVVRSDGEEVFASTLVREGQLYIIVERLGEDTRAGRTLKLLQEAPVEDTRIANYAGKIADRMVLPTILLGGLVFALTRNAARAASVLTIDFATGIRVSVPTTVMAALIAAARNGILIRSGRALEQLGRIEAIVFDKTGTLTQGDVAMVGIKTALAETDPLEVLRLAAAAEQRITHPVAEAITGFAHYHELIIPERGEWDYQVGLGITANIEAKIVLVGSERFLIKEGIDLESLYTRHPDLKTTDYPMIYVACEGQAMGVIQYTDPLRPESKAVVYRLREEFGAEIHILTGDNRQRANIVGHELEIPANQIHAEAFPEDKANLIQKLHNEGKVVAFVGDGLNDSAALAYADVSVSFRDGSEVARETADVVLMKNNLQGLIEAISLARYSQKIIYQNTGIVAVPNISGLAIAATIGLNPMAATLINNGSSVIAGMNGLRPAFAKVIQEQPE